MTPPGRADAPTDGSRGRHQSDDGAPPAPAADAAEGMLEMLARQGFARPERWLPLARRQSFRRVPAERLSACPDCGASAFRRLGQYVYYSNLIALRECGACRLIYADARIPPEVVQAHFESAYKDESYFLRRRRAIFEQLAGWVDRIAPAGGRVLDVGGATGHLMATVRQRRPDLELTVSDLSAAACRQAEERFGFRTICGGVAALERSTTAYDVVVMSDVIYYEPEIARLWALLPRLVAPHGSVVIRVPNKLLPIRLWQALLRRVAPKRLEMADRVRFFNPEHLFVFSRDVLERRLHGLGFTEVRVLPARVLGGRGVLRPLAPLCDGLIRAAYRLSARRVLASPSLLVVARRV